MQEVKCSLLESETSRIVTTSLRMTGYIAATVDEAKNIMAASLGTTQFFSTLLGHMRTSCKIYVN